MTVSSQNWMSRTAVQWAVALAADGTPPQSTVVDNYVFDDSIDGEVHRDKDLPGDAILSSQPRRRRCPSRSRAYIRVPRHGPASSSAGPWLVPVPNRSK